MLNRRYSRNIGKAFLIGAIIALLAGCAAKSVSEEKGDSAPGDSVIISSINTQKIDEGLRVSIKADQEVNYTAVKQQDPLGVILYFPLTQLSIERPVPLEDNDIVASLSPKVSEDKKNTSIEIALKKDSPYKVEKKGSALDIVFREKPSVQGSAAVNRPEEAASPEKVIEEQTISAQMESAQEEASPAQSFVSNRSNKGSDMAAVNRIDFSAQEDGKSAVIIETENPVDYEIRKLDSRLLKVVLYNTSLPEYHQNRPLITTRFDSAVDRIIPARVKGGQDSTKVLIELRETVPYRPVQTGKRLSIHFEPSGIAPRPFEATDLPSWQQVLESESKNAMPSITAAGREKKSDEEIYSQFLLGEAKEYTGQKIALDFFETNIKNVFRILQQVSGKNFAVDPNVSGSVTLSFQKPVPWDQVLDLVLQMNGLEKVERGEIIRIATKETIRAEEEARRQKVEAFRARQEQQKELAPMVTEYLAVSYANAKNEVLPHVKEVLSKDRGNVSVDERNNQLIITDTKKKIEKAREIIGEIDKVTPQVIIEARIVEANDNFSRKVGVTWTAGGDEIYRSDMGGDYSYNSVINTPFIGGAADGGTETPSTFNFSFERLPSMGTPFLLDATLRAMETDQVLKIISTPKIVTLDNKEATITQGVEWPYQNVEDDEVETEFKEINLTLKVIPHITPDNRVSLEINLKKDDIQEITASGEPAISTNEAVTELLIDNGQTIVIGGIVKRTENNAEAGLPFLKDIPGIGWIFSAQQDEVSKRELLIFMTPNIVQLEQRGLVQAENQ